MSWVNLSPTRGSSVFFGKVTALGVLYCFALFVCLFDLACFFFNMYNKYYSCVHSLCIRSVYNPIPTASTLVPLAIENGLKIRLLTVIDAVCIASAS